MNCRFQIIGLLVAVLLLPSSDLFARGGGGGGGRGGFGGGGFGGGGGGFHGYGGGGYGGGGGYRGGYGGGGFGGYGGYRGGDFGGYHGGEIGGGDFRSSYHPDFGSAGNFGGHDAFSRSDAGRSMIDNPYAREGGFDRNNLNFNSRPTEQRLDSFLGLPHTGGEGRADGLAGGDRGRIDIHPTNRAGADHDMHNRPAWQNLNRQQLNGINNKVSNAWGRDGKGRQDMHNWLNNHPNRAEHWRNWANDVRDHDWNHHDWNRGNWWRHHYPYGNWWNYWGFMGLMPWGYWWNVPTWGGIGDYCGDMGDPIYYDYGDGGNVYTDDNGDVYVNGQNVGTMADYSKSAAELATVDPPADDAANDAAQWLPLGNFSVSTSQKDTDPTRVMQLAVNKQGIVSGMLYNQTTDKSLPIQGRVDKSTQRVAFRIGNNDHIVCETGIYDLTKNEAPLLVHFGGDKTEQYLLVRLDKPQNYGDEELPVPATDSSASDSDGTQF